MSNVNQHDNEERGGTGRTRNRSRTSLYLDRGIIQQADKAYKEIAHDLYPLEIDKSDFLEALFSFGLSHLVEIRKMLAPQQP